MSSHSTLRLATELDLPAICLLAEDLAAIHHEEMPKVFAPPSGGERDAQYWRDSICGEDRAAFLLERDGAPIGFISVAIASETSTILQPARFVRINSVCVCDAWRGQGLGRKLLEAAESWGIQRGATEARLSVAAFNQRALALYQELGYSVRTHALAKAFASHDSNRWHTDQAGSGQA